MTAVKGRLLFTSAVKARVGERGLAGTMAPAPARVHAQFGEEVGKRPCHRISWRGPFSQV